MKVWRDVFAMVSKGVQMSGGTDPNLEQEVGGCSSYCQSVAIVWVFSRKEVAGLRHSSDCGEW